MKATTLLIANILGATCSLRAEPQLTSWLTSYSSKYARIYQTDAAKASGASVTTWTNGTQVQSSPAYCGVQEISYSANWIYVRTTGLGSHVMGPWYLNAAHTQTFPNLPKNQRVLYRFPRTAVVPTIKTLTGAGTIGLFVDGVAMFDSRDTFYWNGTTEVGGGTGLWNREAYLNEGITFDPGYAHQEQSGTHHYHADPIALRYLLGDHIDFNAATKRYSESTTPVSRHSPILGWVRDGYPIYGPYGYSGAMDANSGVRRMVSGYVLRNGQNGTDNLTSAGRTSIPAWAQRAYNAAASQSGPAVSTTYPLGRYMEDNAYLGDLGRTQGIDFDLDEYNGRFCVTPEFPNGTYAYFVAIGPNGAPVFPYNIGRAFYGSPTGSTQTTISETVNTVFSGGPNMQEAAEVGSVDRLTGNVTLVWSSVEGGTYQVETSINLTSWTTLATTSGAANSVTTSHVDNGAALLNLAKFYRVTRTALAAYDAVTATGGGGGEGISSVSPTSGTRGTMVSLTITLNSAAQPAPPPNNLQPAFATLTQGATTITASTATRNTATGIVTAAFTLPAAAATGAYDVNVAFPPPPGQTENVVFSKAGGFVVNAAAASFVQTTTTSGKINRVRTRR
jgi:hypothetical protein